MENNIVFFDIDGTLLDSNKRIPESTKQAVEKLKQNDIYVAIATGRAPFMFEDIRNELGINSYVSFNGQYVVFEGETIYNHSLEQGELANLYRHTSEHNHPMIFMNEKKMRATEGNHPHITKSLGSLQCNYPEVDPNFFENHKIYQALLFCEEDQEDVFKTTHDVFHYVRWHDYSCDVLPGGGSKAVGVQKLMEAAGLTQSNSYAFGDGLNDLEMLREIGTGIAMGNSVPALKHVADYTTDHVDNDGIMNGLRHFQLL
jgi:Cof subfamily protein (haloacid dehalogenase superfamily)